MNNTTAQKIYLAAAFFLVLCAASFSGCINEDTAAQVDQTVHEWMDTEMTNVATDETFTLRELTQDGTPLVVHIFATWCPACNSQLGESTTFLENYPGKAHVVSIDIDASESPAAVADHITKRGYAGTFTTSEVPVVQGLMDLFGQEIMMQIPQTVLISGDNLLYLGPGVISSDNLAGRIDAMYQQLGK